MKFISPLTFAAVAGTLLIAGPTVYASDTDDRIESSAAKSYTFKEVYFSPVSSERISGANG